MRPILTVEAFQQQVQISVTVIAVLSTTRNSPTFLLAERFLEVNNIHAWATGQVFTFDNNLHDHISMTKPCRPHSHVEMESHRSYLARSRAEHMYGQKLPMFLNNISSVFICTALVSLLFFAKHTRCGNQCDRSKVDAHLVIIFQTAASFKGYVRRKISYSSLTFCILKTANLSCHLIDSPPYNSIT
jgi:hypothetical protein